MGCVECKICKQDEEKNQFEYNNEASKKIENEMLRNTKNNNLLLKLKDTRKILIFKNRKQF